MTFYASYFTYNGVVSSDYGLRINSMDSPGVNRYAGASVELKTQKVYRNPKPYLFGVEETPVLTIPITITVSSELDSTQSSSISKWLFGQTGYKKLQILQPDMMYVYFNCIFNQPQIIKVGGTIRGYTANIICDSPFAWSYQEISEFPFGLGKYLIDQDIVLNNLSDSADYYYPDMEIKMNKFTGGLTLTNYSDNNRVFSLSDLAAGELIRIKGDSKIITSSYRDYPIENMEDGGYKWFRYIPGKNNVRVYGNVEYIRFIHNFPKKIM